MSELCVAKFVQHPFDNEDEVSLRHLYKSLWNHVTLGQWELARVCLGKLYRARTLLKKPLKDVLRAVIDRPTFVGTGSPSVSTPLHLSWLCLVDYLHLFISQEDKLPSQISLTVEFHLLLYLSNCKTAPKQVLQELDNYYSNIIYGDTSGFKDDTLSSNSIQFLKGLLDQDPEFGHAIISQLNSKAKTFLENNQTLQELYISGIQQLLGKLARCDARNTGKADLEIVDSMKNQLYTMLSVMNPTPEMVSLLSPLESLFTSLIQHSKSLETPQLDIGNLYSSLLQRPTSFLLQNFCDVENKLHFNSDVEGNGALGGSILLPNQAAYVCLSQSNMKDRTEAMKFLFFHALNGNHVLENIVETALLFIKNGDFGKVNLLLSDFQVLKPLVLLLGWPYCYSCENARNLLDTLWDQKAPIDHPLLYQTCEKLAYQVQLVQWCLEKAGLLLASSEAGSTHHQQASEMFQGLESHSVLRVLHKSISLAQLPEKEVFDLLQKRPVFSSRSDNTEGNKRDDDLFEGQSSIHPEVERDLIIYHSFCAIRSFMDCVFNQGCDNECEKPSTSYDNPALSLKLSNGRHHLTKVFPLTYRVEILENIFSLLFATYEDLYSENSHHDSDALDTGDDDTKSMNTSLTGSMESLASITSTDTAEALGLYSPSKDFDPDSPVKLKGHTRSGSHDSKGIKTMASFGVITKEGVGVRSEPSTPTKQKGHSRTSSHDLSMQILQNSARGLPNLVSSASKKPREEPGDKSGPTTPVKNTKQQSCEHASLGFIVDNEVVPEYLKVLKDCLLDVNAAKLVERQSGKSSIYSNPDWLYTSIGSNVLEQRISRLSQYIVEAQWRYQLVSWNGDLKNTTKEKPRSSQKSSPSSPEKIQPKKTTEESQQSVDEPKRSNSKDSDDTDQNSDESSSYQSQELTTGTEDNLSYKASKKHSRPSRHGRKSSVTEGLVVKDDSCVARMLSSPETLIYMCLRKDSYDRAQQVIKMFKMNGKPTANAAIFAEKFFNAFKELSALQPKTRQNLSGHKSSSRTLGAIAMAAASGVSSTVTSNLIDQLLASPIPSPLMLCDVGVCDDDARKLPLYSYVHPELIPVMVCLDLACTVNVPVDVCRNLLETANSRLLQVEEAVTLKQEGSLVGVAEVLFDLYQLLTQDHKSTSSSFLSTQQNLIDFLLGRQPLKVKPRNLSSKHENEQKESIQRMERAVEEGDTTIVAIEKATSKVPSGVKKPHESNASSFSLVDKVLSVRVALTELQNSYSCTSSFAMSGVGSKKEKFDYLRSLLNHVDTIATLLLHWQSKPDDLSGFSKDVAKGVLARASNPFVVLNKGIAETFGKPMFEKNVSPKRLEGICKQLNINLVKVIVDNCCPHITSCGLSSERGYCWPSPKVLVLNDCTCWLDNARDPNVVAKELLTEMIILLTDIAQTNNGLVDASCAVSVVTSAKFSTIVQGTRELQRVDLELLQTSEAKFCFFINVLNLLIAHSSLLLYSVESTEEPRKRLRNGSILSCISGCGVEGKQSVSSLDRVSFLKQHCYTIGQLGPTSAFDILFMIIRSGLIPPTMFGSAIQLCYPERPVDDPKRKYKPSHQDKRVVFAVSDGCLSSPDLQVYDVEELEFQLNAAAMSYVNSHVTVEDGQVVLPELLNWYRSDFTQETFGELNKTTEATNASFLLLLEPFLNYKKAALLQSTLSNIKITYTPFCWTFGYKFEVSSLDHSESASNLQQSSSVSDSLHLSLELSGTDSVCSIESRGNFRPNDTILEYLSKESPLVSTLVELVCPTSSNNSLDKGAALLSKELGFNGALKKVADFPALQRAIASRFYCIAEFLTLASGDMEISGSYELVRADSQPLSEDAVDASPTIKFCPLVLSAINSTELKFAYKRCSDFFLRQGNFYCLLELIRTADIHGDGSCSETLDYLLVSALLGKGCSNEMFPKRLDALLSDLDLPSIGFTHKWHKKPWTLLAQIKDDNQLAQLVLSHLKEYKAKVGLDLLNLALSRPPSNIALRKELEHRKKEISLHDKITQCAKAPQFRATEALDRPQSPGALTQWQSIGAKTVDDPGQIMEFLISIQQYELAGSWAELHGLPHEYHRVIKESHLKCLLESSSEDTMKAYCILEGIQEQHMALEICQSLLQQKLHVSQILFIIQFMLTNLQHHLSPLRMQELLLTKMGAKALLCIPEMARSCYEHLVSRPNLLLEQLLMNLKVEWAVQVFSHLQVDLAMMKEGTVKGGQHDCTVQAFDSLLATYAAKALEFQVVQTQPSPEITFTANEDVLSSSPSSLTGYGGRSTPVGDIPSSIKDFRNSLQQSVSSLAREPFKRYVPPAIPPSKEEWMPDSDALKCIICQEGFSMFNRRHHCRRCGRVVCGACSKHTSIVQNYGDTPVRVCDSCYTRCGDRAVTVEKTDLSASPLRADTGSLSKSMGQAESTADNYGNSPYVSEIKAESEVANKWRLSLDLESNTAVREEFYFEQAPSSSLCIAILDLHSDNLECGQLLLELCNNLSKKLVPISPGVRNDEVDHTLIISMIRYLLFNAKLKMIKAGETGGLELCDTYLSHVELMKFLVESNCGDIPSLQDLTHTDSARRLRDRFIEDERLTLAMEVSTKCGLESSSVWAASGFACLQAGDFAAAREKFSMCMKSSDGKIQQKQYSQYLDKIMDILQSYPLISYSQSTDELLSPLRGLAEHCKSSTHSNILDNKRFEECLYYLRAYGNDLSLVSFYGRHGHLKLACRYVLDKKCNPDVFVEGLLMRLISKGSVSNLKDQMEVTDPTLQSWTPYLTASCRFLNKRGYHHLLYDLQLFMKDHFRAAQTCIRFFEGTAGSSVTSYKDLHSRLDYLNKARSHIEAVIIEKKSPRNSSHSATSWLRSHSNLRRKSSEEMHHGTINLSELTSYVNTINLQIEVTNFIHKCSLEGGNVLEGLRASNEGEKLPTLFGNGHVKAELAIQVLLAGSTIQEGFSLASRIIQDYNLPAPRVYVDAGRTLARQYRFTHIHQLLKCVAEMGLISDKCHDEIILACIRIISTDQSQAKHVEHLIKLLKNDSNKIDAFLLCGKLRSAYLIAVKESNVEAVHMIAEEAQKTGQNKTLSLCKKWLTQHQKVAEAEKQSAADQSSSRK